MPEGPDGKTIIIVKKISGHGGHHGGAWKVAYADFITAMMALFLVLWLVNSAAEPTRQRIASYFRKPGIFEKGSGTPLEMGGGGILPDTFAPPADANSQIITSKKIYEIDAHTGKVKDYFDPGDKSGENEAAGGETATPETAKTPEQMEESEGQRRVLNFEELEKLRQELEQAASGSAQSPAQGQGKDKEGGAGEVNKLGQVDIKVDQRGLLLEIMDTDSSSMFQVGSAAIQSDAAAQLARIAKVLHGLPNPLDIEGHTDARPYRGKNAETYDNWDLSVDRANSARRVLQQAGIEDRKIARVVGYADQRPKVPGSPLDPSNRRITIAMRFSEQAKTALEGTKTVETRPKLVGANSAGHTPAAPAQPPVPPSVNQSSASPFKEIPAKTAAPAGRTDRLQVDVGTTMPEGAVMSQPDDPSAEEEHRLDKDKIFGRSNSFFSD